MCSKIKVKHLTTFNFVQHRSKHGRELSKAYVKRIIVAIELIDNILEFNVRNLDYNVEYQLSLA